VRAVVVKDPHLRFGRSRPVGRRASFFDEVRGKLEFVKDYCVGSKIKFLIFTGDVLDQKDPSRYSFECYRENRECLEEFRGANINVLSVFGNHDIVDGRYRDSVYADFARMELIYDLSVQSGGAWVGQDYCVIGVGHIYDIDGFKQNLSHAVSEYSFCGKLICVIHQNVISDLAVGSEKFLNTLKYYTLVQEFPDVAGWVCGHYHKGFPVAEVEGRYFINPYSLVRLSRDSYVREHVPQLVDCDFENDIYKTVDIPYLSYDEAFEEVAQVLSEDVIDCDLIENVKKLRSSVILQHELLEEDEMKSLVEHYLTEADKLLK
jgi:DNA repair exonuclease SbcCD nuclease subunit